MYACMQACMYACMHVCMYVCMYVWCSVARPPPPSPPHGYPPLTGPIMLPSPPRPPVVWVVGGLGGAVVYVGCLTPAHPPVVWWWVLGLTPPSPPCNVVWCGGGLWVSGLVFNPFPPPCGVVVGVGFRVCTPAPPVVWVVGFRV